jgi:uncharacterized CHY-type Zn-finger protein
MYDNGYPTIDAQITTQSQSVPCPHCKEYTVIPPYRDSPVTCDKCKGKFNVPGKLG